MFRLGSLFLLLAAEEEFDETFGWSFFVVIEDVDELAKDFEGSPVDLDDLVLEEGVDDGEGVRPTEGSRLETFGESRKTQAGSLTDVRTFV